MPLTIDQIAKFCADFDDITYIDICTYIEDLKESKYITEQTEQGNILYLPTELGKNILKELLELIPGVDLYKLKKHINKKHIFFIILPRYKKTNLLIAEEKNTI